MRYAGNWANLTSFSSEFSASEVFCESLQIFWLISNTDRPNKKFLILHIISPYTILLSITTSSCLSKLMSTSHFPSQFKPDTPCHHLDTSSRRKHKNFLSSEHFRYKSKSTKIAFINCISGELFLAMLGRASRTADLEPVRLANLIDYSPFAANNQKRLSPRTLDNPIGSYFSNGAACQLCSHELTQIECN